MGLKRGPKENSARGVEVRLTVLNQLIMDQEFYLSQLRLRKVRLEFDLKQMARARNKEAAVGP